MSTDPGAKARLLPPPPRCAVANVVLPSIRTMAAVADRSRSPATATLLSVPPLAVPTSFVPVTRVAPDKVPPAIWKF